MPRRHRFYRLNFCHHVMLRGVNGHELFFDDCDRCRFCLLLQKAAEQHSFQIHAFCLMSNHIHLILEPNSSSLQECVHAFSFRYAQYFNRRYNRRGYLFQGRFKSIFVETGEYLKKLTRYIHRNPIESGMVQRVEDYPWSSHRAYLGEKEYFWLAKDFILSRFGFNQEEAVSNFRDYVNRGTCAKIDLDEIVNAHRRGAYGSIEFIEANTKEVGKKKGAISLNQVLEWTCAKLQVTEEDLKSETKKSQIVEARSLLAYMGRSLGLYTLRDLARTLNKHESTLSRLASKAEKRSDLKELANQLL